VHTHIFKLKYLGGKHGEYASIVPIYVLSFKIFLVAHTQGEKNTTRIEPLSGFFAINYSKIDSNY
jgi:hypothetical protein